MTPGTDACLVQILRDGVTVPSGTSEYEEAPAGIGNMAAGNGEDASSKRAAERGYMEPSGAYRKIKPFQTAAFLVYYPMK